MKIRRVAPNARKRCFDLLVGTRRLSYPFGRLAPTPSAEDRVKRVFVDHEIGGEGFAYVLQSGAEGTVHVEQVLDYNRDPDYLRSALIYRLTLDALARVETSGLSRREIIRRLGTSASQFYRLLDPRNERKSVDRMLALLSVLDCEVDFVVRSKTA